VCIACAKTHKKKKQGVPPTGVVQFIAGGSNPSSFRGGGWCWQCGGYRGEGVLMLNGMGCKWGIGVLGPYHHSHSISALYGISPTHPGTVQHGQDPSKYRSYFGNDPEHAFWRARGHKIDESPAPVTCGKWNALEERSSCKSNQV